MTLRVPYWSESRYLIGVPMSQGSYHLGGSILGSPSFVNPHMVVYDTGGVNLFWGSL